MINIIINNSNNDNDSRIMLGGGALPALHPPPGRPSAGRKSRALRLSGALPFGRFLNHHWAGGLPPPRTTSVRRSSASPFDRLLNDHWAVGRCLPAPPLLAGLRPAESLESPLKNEFLECVPHARCRLGPKMGALRKLITEENNGSRDAPTADYPLDADSR